MSYMSKTWSAAIWKGTSPLSLASGVTFFTEDIQPGVISEFAVPLSPDVPIGEAAYLI